MPTFVYYAKFQVKFSFRDVPIFRLEIVAIFSFFANAPPYARIFP